MKKNQDTNFKNYLKTHEIHRKPFLFRLTGRFTLFFFLQLILFLLFYVSGNYQHFLDTTQNLILFLCSAISIILILLSLTGLLLSIVFFTIQRKAFYWVYFSCYLFILLTVPAIFIALRVLTILSRGLGR